MSKFIRQVLRVKTDALKSIHRVRFIFVLSKLNIIKKMPIQ